MPAERPTAGLRPLRPHHSLLFRLLASSLLIVVFAIAATAWLAVRSTTSAVRQQQGQVLRDDTAIYQAMMSYAATHPDWHDVGPVVRRLAHSTGLHITLEAQNTSSHRTVTAWPPGSARHTDRAFAVIDPLHVDPALTASGGGGTIDPHALGPYRLAPADQRRLSTLADGIARCLTTAHVAYTRTLGPGGLPRIALTEAPGLRSRIDGTDSFAAKVADKCGLPALDTPTTGERKALAGLNVTLGSCLARQHLAVFRVGLDFLPTTVSTSASTPAGRACVEAARREQLAPYVAPATLLYVGEDPGATFAGFDLSRSNGLRVLAVTAAVLLLAVAVTVLNGTRLTGSLRALTRAVRDGADRYVTPRGHDEIGRLTAAFNEMATHRARVERERQAMVGDIAHELRTPLSTMRSTLEAGQDGVIPVDEHLATSLLEETLLLQHIIDDLQDLAAADAGTLRLHPEVLRARDILDHVAVVHRTAAERAGVTVSVTTDGEGPELSADPLRLRQILGNLLSNAVRYTRAGDTITLGARWEEACVVIDVADSGPGIPPEDLPYLFDRFWRAEKSRSRSTGGSGLGLAIARKLTEAHGGTLTVISTPVRGTVFTVRLP